VLCVSFGYGTIVHKFDPNRYLKTSTITYVNCDPSHVSIVRHYLSTAKLLPLTFADQDFGRFP
jgi:hypothetical protein